MRLDIAKRVRELVAIECQNDVLARRALEKPLEVVARPCHRDHVCLVALVEAPTGDPEKELRGRFRILQGGRDLLTRNDRGDGALCRDLLGESCRTKCFHYQPPPA